MIGRSSGTQVKTHPTGRMWTPWRPLCSSPTGMESVLSWKTALAEWLYRIKLECFAHCPLGATKSKHLLHEYVEKVLFIVELGRRRLCHSVRQDGPIYPRIGSYGLFFSGAQEFLIHQFIHNDLRRRTDDILSAAWIKGVGLPGPDQLPIGRIVQIGLQRYR